MDNEKQSETVIVDADIRVHWPGILATIQPLLLYSSSLSLFMYDP